jgi:hypothetical protein
MEGRGFLAFPLNANCGLRLPVAERERNCVCVCTCMHMRERERDSSNFRRASFLGAV